MPNKINRAAQFLPFDSLKGLQEELRRREYVNSKELKRDLSEERQQNISNELLKVKKGSIVRVEYYFDEHYFNIEGKVSVLNVPFKYLIVNDNKILFSDLYDLKVVG